MILYHASDKLIPKPDISFSREALDFGKGFYLTVLKEQAVKYSKRFTGRGKDAYLNVYILDDAVLDSLKVKRFDSYDEEWLDFISKCRTLKNIDNYDIVIGGIANDKVFNTIDLYFDGLISRSEALSRLKYEKPNHQLCVKHQDVIDRYLEFKESIKLKK